MCSKREMQGRRELQSVDGSSLRTSNPVVETRTSYCAGLSAAAKVAEPYSASSTGLSSA